jgi:hypothetical protein
VKPRVLKLGDDDVSVDRISGSLCLVSLNIFTKYIVKYRSDRISVAVRVENVKRRPSVA